ncbi:pancreatic lipase-related protein 2 [Fopius arisanus]|uniref:phospholipase A1 n=1 Tax=Fopius arisanus TaxID=64838 RepID=A0A9R1TZC0_9HYME|nr:PREDICTED: pancreatic lipase-related protein 2-like [Fopius arisanus]XP_011301890.1 PREDICTED: pancreatic lipase-related protein 2-like [Fopius arisanus]XP_011301898.1 PREDICTED: pancreatic lipase-related protein 2-like [Fopius arisanus]
MPKLWIILLVCGLSVTIGRGVVLEDVTKGKEDDVKCFGIGSIVAKILQWIFREPPVSSRDGRVRFLVHSRTSQVPYQLFAEDDQFEISFSSFKPERRTVFIVHGFLAHGEQAWIQKMVKAYLEFDDVNVIAVDWSQYSNILNYYKAVVNAQNAACAILKFLQLTVASYRETREWGDIHLIGHSLGAHVSGMAADGFKEMVSRWKITRITGLDPAQPCFAASDLSLGKTDAPFVDIIHTNGQFFAGMGLGMKDPIGHVDFYANGGQRQPGCSKEVSIWEKPRAEIMESVCSHKRSYEYFIESLQLAARNMSNKFWGHEWNQSPIDAAVFVGKDCEDENCVEMGINADKYEHRGVFFVSTGSTNPYVVITELDRQDILEQLEIDGSSIK